MPTEPMHYKEELQELLDDRLPPDLRTRVEAHLASCPECRAEVEALRLAREVTRTNLPVEDIPAGLEANILRALDREDERANRGLPALFRQNAWRWGIAAAALIAVGAALYFYLLPGPDFPALVAKDFGDYGAQTLRLDHNTSDVKEMERYFAEHGISFETRVFDLGMMNFQLVGGRVHTLGGRASAFFVYRNSGGKALMCQMYRGRTTELPPGAVERENNGIRFHVYNKLGVTAVFWQEGEIVCVLASDLAQEEVVQLAFAKAVKI